jgi:GDSL-like Lipase/Acylhydrolase family
MKIKTPPCSAEASFALAMALSVAFAAGCASTNSSSPDDRGGGGAAGHRTGGVSAGGANGGAGTLGSGGTGSGGTGSGGAGTGGTGNGATGGISGGGGHAGGGGVGAVGGAGGGGAGSAGRGGAGGVMMTGGAGGGAYNPCPPSGACVILPFGDSITWGWAGVENTDDLGGYRAPLFALAVADGRSLTLVGSQADGPATVSGKTFPRNHEGHAGYTIDNSGSLMGVTPLVVDAPGVIRTSKPNIVLLMIGTNDMSNSVDLPNAPARLGKLIDDIFADAPDALIVVAQITPSQKGPANSSTQTYNAAIPGIVQQRVAAGKHLAVVNMNAAFVARSDWASTLMTDSVHPNAAGYEIMAQTWYPAISGFLR